MKGFRRGGRLPEEHPAQPPTGFKIAYPMLSDDGTVTAFSGVSVGGAVVYAALADARCVYGRGHAAPGRGCDCGFYCLHSIAAARAMGLMKEYRGAAVLEVAVLGRYTRYERGIRYGRQRVRSVSVGPCACGAPSQTLVDNGYTPGWRQLAGACAGCAGRRAEQGFGSLSFAAFGRLSGVATMTVGPDAGGSSAAATPAADELVPQLIAEVALLQARLDHCQAQLQRLTGPATPPGQ